MSLSKILSVALSASVINMLPLSEAMALERSFIILTYSAGSAPIPVSSIFPLFLFLSPGS